jgi:hypothetical protein
VLGAARLCDVAFMGAAERSERIKANVMIDRSSLVA